LLYLYQFEIGSQTDSLSSMVDETSLQDIENFSIFKGLKGQCLYCESLSFYVF